MEEERVVPDSGELRLGANFSGVQDSGELFPEQTSSGADNDFLGNFGAFSLNNFSKTSGLNSVSNKSKYFLDTDGKMLQYVVDSGAGIHIHRATPPAAEINTPVQKCTIECASGEKVEAVHAEPPQLFSEEGERLQLGDSQANVFCNGIQHNIFSVSRATDLGYKLNLGGENNFLTTPCGKRISIYREDNLYFVTL